MDHSDVLLLARAQFGLNIAFHILFPTLTIGLAWILVYFRVRAARSGDAAWLAIYKLWTKVFAITFAMGVVTGITMSFQFGTNWPGYMQKVGNIAGPLLAFEVLFAFFLEATFLGVMLYGMNRVPAWIHIAATLLVAIGTTLSAFWILALNSWMQTPAGHVLDGGKIIAGDWWQVIFNPSFPYRLTHMLLASGLTASFAVAGLSAWRLLHASEDASARKTLRTGLVLAAVLAPLQIFVGDLHGLNTLEHQPAKIAAIEAIWKTEKGVPLVLFAIPDEEKRRNDFSIEIPKGASLVLRHDANAELQGIDAFAPNVAPVAPVFFAFRVMVGMGVLMLLAAWSGVWATRKAALPRRWMLWAFSGLTFAGWIATLAGWLVTEIGRQPWLVTGILKTADAAGAASGAQLGASLTGYIITYTVMLILGVGMLMPAASADEQELMVASIGPFWDANETWVVLGVGILLVAFPAAHGLVLGALYLPVAAMLVGLMLRGVAFEFRVKAEGWHRGLWNWLFWFGSFLASFAQGLMLGRYVTGFHPGFGYYLFAMLVGASLCGGYVLLGATWLVLKTEGDLQKKALAWARWGLIWVALGVALVSLATPLVSHTVQAKWFDFPRTLALMLLPLATVAAGWMVWAATGRLKRGEREFDWMPLAATVAIFTLAFAGLAYSLFPYVVMDRMTIWEAASHPSALKFVLAGVVIVLPFLIAYTAFAHRVFRGKARAGLYE
jgi:cytochrome d ubiquinol oxidase subunit I